MFKTHFKKFPLSQRRTAARQIDFYGLLLLVWALTWLGLASWSWALAIGICLVEGGLLFWGRKHWNRWGQEQRTHQQLKRLAQAQIQNLEPDFIGELWQKLGCANLETLPEKAGFKLWQGKINGVNLLLAESSEELVKEETAEKFLQLVGASDLKGGILLTAGKFSPAALQKALYFDRRYLLRFWDGHYLAELIIQAGLELPPSDRPKLRIPRFRPLPRKEYLWAAAVMLLMLYFPLPSYLKYCYGVFAILNLGIYAYARYIRYLAGLNNSWETIKPKGNS